MIGSVNASSLRAPLAAMLLAGAVLGCSDDDNAGDASGTTGAPSTSTTGADATTTPPTSAPDRPDGPVADVSQVLEGGNGVFIGASEVLELPVGWVEDERAADGTAVSYRSANGLLPPDGHYELVEDLSAQYRVRVLVRRPADAEAFSGAVAVEWLNVSGGVDASPDFTFLAEELFRTGTAWVGVSAQRIGIEGGPVAVGVEGAEGVAGVGLRAIDPARYGDLRHPGDAFSYDIYTQVARAIRDGDLLGDLRVDRVLAVGESQSAFTLTTYANGVQPLTRAFDGFLVHSRAAAPAPLGAPDAGIDIAGSLGGEPTLIRDDLEVPVLVVETETDVLSVLGYHAARQDDTDRFRLWEIAGTAHADRFLVGERADSLDCGGPINAGPARFVVRAALRALDTWIATGEAPPSAPRLDVDATPAFVRDADGIVLGGIRTPHVDVPVDVHSGDTRGSSVICLLLGSSTPIPNEQLVERYGTAEAYLAAYEASTDEAIGAGFVLADDRDEVLADARPERLPG